MAITNVNEIALLGLDAASLQSNVEELCKGLGRQVSFRANLINKSKQFPNERQVFRLVSNDHDFALKTDVTTGHFEALETEFHNLKRLHLHFEKRVKLSITKPVLLSSAKNFLVTEYVNAPTALEKIQSGADPTKAKQIFRRTALWLNALHRIEPASPSQFWPGWMLSEIKDAASECKKLVDNEFYQSSLKRLEKDASSLRGVFDLSVFSHGDFHGNNILVGRGKTCGLDFSQSKVRLAAYDIVEIMMMDFQIDTPVAELNSFGLTERICKDFFRVYEQKIRPDIFEFCIRARLLLDWVRISSRGNRKTKFQMRRFNLLNTRLAVAFALDRRIS